MQPIRLAASLSAAFMLVSTVSTMALAAPVCSAPVKVLAQPRDGYTLLLCTHFDATNTAVYRNAGYQLGDIAPISLIAKYYYGLALANVVPVDDFKSFQFQRVCNAACHKHIGVNQ